MLQPKSPLPKSRMQQRFFCIATAAVLSLLCSGCGSSSSKNENLSPAQAQAVSQQIVTTLENAVSSVSASLAVPDEGHRSLARTLRDTSLAQSSDCTTNSNGESCNIPISYSGPCPGGGSIAVSGDFDFSLNNSGSGSDSTTITVTPANCSVSNLTINGNPSVTVATQISFVDDQPQFPLTFTEGGGISYGPNPAGSCTLNVKLTISSESSCTVSGTVCGQSVNGSC